MTDYCIIPGCTAQLDSSESPSFCSQCGDSFCSDHLDPSIHYCGSIGSCDSCKKVFRLPPNAIAGARDADKEKQRYLDEHLRRNCEEPNEMHFLDFPVTSSRRRSTRSMKRDSGEFDSLFQPVAGISVGMSIGMDRTGSFPFPRTTRASSRNSLLGDAMKSPGSAKPENGNNTNLSQRPSLGSSARMNSMSGLPSLGRNPSLPLGMGPVPSLTSSIPNLGRTNSLNQSFTSSNQLNSYSSAILNPSATLLPFTPSTPQFMLDSDAQPLSWDALKPLNEPDQPKGSEKSAAAAAVAAATAAAAASQANKKGKKRKDKEDSEAVNSLASLSAVAASQSNKQAFPQVNFVPPITSGGNAQSQFPFDSASSTQNNSANLAKKQRAKGKAGAPAPIATSSQPPAQVPAPAPLSATLSMFPGYLPQFLQTGAPSTSLNPVQPNATSSTASTGKGNKKGKKGSGAAQDAGAGEKSDFQSSLEREIAVVNDGIRQVLSYVPLHMPANGMPGSVPSPRPQEGHIDALINGYKHQFTKYQMNQSEARKQENQRFCNAIVAYFAHYYGTPSAIPPLPTGFPNANAGSPPLSPKSSGAAANPAQIAGAGAAAVSFHSLPNSIFSRHNANDLLPPNLGPNGSILGHALSAIASALLMNPFELAVWSLYLERLDPGWTLYTDSKSILKSLCYTAYAMKCVFTEDSALYLPLLTGLEANFSSGFSDFMDMRKELKLGIPPTVMNQRYVMMANYQDINQTAKSPTEQ